MRTNTVAAMVRKDIRNPIVEQMEACKVVVGPRSNQAMALEEVQRTEPWRPVEPDPDG